MVKVLQPPYLPECCDGLVQCYPRVHDSAQESLHTSFKTTGICPFNPEIFTDEDFAPAQSFSLAFHVPKSYLCEVITSSPAPSNFSDSSDSDIDVDLSNSNDASDPHTSQAPAPQSPIDWDTDPN